MKKIQDIKIKVGGIWYTADNKKLKSFKNIEACIIKETMSKKELKEYSPEIYKKYYNN